MYNILNFQMYSIDPHVRIAGLPEDVKAAKMQVMSVLDDRVRIFSFTLNNVFSYSKIIILYYI